MASKTLYKRMRERGLLERHESGRLEQAAEQLQRAVELDPGHAMSRHRLGVLRERQGRRDEALAAYREALALDPRLKVARAALTRLE